MVYDISIWERVGSSVKWKTASFEQTIKADISRDRSLREFYGIYPVPWQLTEVLAQRADDWIDRLYRVCCDANGKETTPEFDRAVWAYFIEPFFMQEVQTTEEGYRASRLLELLLCAVGSLPENRRQLKVGQKERCIQVRSRLHDKWYAKLHHVPSKMDKAVAAPPQSSLPPERRSHNTPCVCDRPTIAGGSCFLC